jgi:hypothetical protein
MQTAASRKRFLAAAGGSATLLLAACGGTKKQSTPGGSNPNTGAGLGTDQFGKGDIGVLGYALTLEYLEADFYGKALASGKLSGQAAALARTFHGHELQHVATLEAAIRQLGGQPPARPKTQFQLTDQKSILAVASTLEGVGADAYLDQLGRLESKALLSTALSIHTVEARHAAAINSLLGTDIAPDGAFPRPALASDVLQQLKAFVTQ